MKKITTLEMEVELSKFLYFRKNIVVPNVSWGMFSHECDLIRLTPSGYCTEIEIKVTLSDLKKDRSKRHNHIDGKGCWENKIKYLYFAIPGYLKDFLKYIPERAGILIVREVKKDWWPKPKLVTSEIRAPKPQSHYKFSEKERIRLLELMAMRIWNLKKKLAKLKKVK